MNETERQQLLQLAAKCGFRTRLEIELETIGLTIRPIVTFSLVAWDRERKIRYTWPDFKTYQEAIKFKSYRLFFDDSLYYFEVQQCNVGGPFLTIPLSR